MLCFEGVTKEFGSHRVLDDACAVLPPNCVNFLMGPNGVGKTTLIKCVLGLEAYTGRITWHGDEIDVTSRGFYPVFDDTPWYGRLTGAQNLSVLAEGSASGPRQYLEPHVLRQRVKRYSYGQRKRLALTAALNSGAEVVILDEPTNGLDLDTMRRLKDDVRQMRTGTTFLVTGHHLEFYDELVDHLFVLKAGKVLEVPVPSTDERSDLALAYDLHYPAAGR